MKYQILIEGQRIDIQEELANDMELLSKCISSIYLVRRRASSLPNRRKMGHHV